tara:strand:+ start:209 stop:460 length:252 start_codon:yes stop_codon:yes gene_type:complete
MSTAELLRLASEYGAHIGLSQATISTYAANDGKFFRRLSEGASCTLKTADKLARWFSTHWPEDLEWPSDIPRPDKNAPERKAS